MRGMDPAHMPVSSLNFHQNHLFVTIPWFTKRAG